MNPVISGPGCQKKKKNEIHRDLTTGWNGEVQVYSIFTYAKLNLMDCELVFSKLIFY